MYQSINVEAFSLEFASQAVDRIIEIILRPFCQSNNVFTVNTSAHRCKKSTTVFIRCSPLNVIINLGSNNANVSSFFFSFFSPHFLTLHCAELALESKDVRCTKAQVAVFSSRTASTLCFPTDSCHRVGAREPRMQIKIFPRRNSGWKLVFPNRADTGAFLAPPNFSFGIRIPGWDNNEWTNEDLWTIRENQLLSRKRYGCIWGEREVNRKNNVLVLRRNRIRKIYGSYMLTIVCERRRLRRTGKQRNKRKKCVTRY